VVNESQNHEEEKKEVVGKPVDPDTFVGDPEMLLKHPLQVKMSLSFLCYFYVAKDKANLV